VKVRKSEMNLVTKTPLWMEIPNIPFFVGMFGVLAVSNIGCSL
jgi:hypothetical protein